MLTPRTNRSTSRTGRRPWSAPSISSTSWPRSATAGQDDAARRLRYCSSMSLADTAGRPLRDLRISVTDRCNFRCTYCMPKEVFGRDFAFLERDALLTFEELARAARLFVRNG